MLDSIGNDKNIMAISHPSCLHVWSIVKCSMGGPPEATVSSAWHVMFCYTLLWGDLTFTNLPQEAILLHYRLMTLIQPLDYLRVNHHHWIKWFSRYTTGE